MILVDLSQVMISNIMIEMNRDSATEPDINFCRYLVLNSLRSYNRKFKNTYGDMVLCCDGRKSWRKEIFPQYKKGRKKSKSKDRCDWSKIYEVISSIIEELKENFPYKVLQIDHAEGDDVIAVLCFSHPNEKILIISSDKDFAQLHTENVRQWNPILGKFKEIDDPKRFLKEHVIRGDVSDGVPNCLSDDDVFMSGRQRPLRKTLVERIISEGAGNVLTEEQMAYLHRNSQVINLKNIPKNIQENILKCFNETETNKRSKIYPYLVKYALRGLMQNITEF